VACVATSPRRWPPYSPLIVHQGARCPGFQRSRVPTLPSILPSFIMLPPRIKAAFVPKGGSIKPFSSAHIIMPRCCSKCWHLHARGAPVYFSLVTKEGTQGMWRRIDWSRFCALAFSVGFQDDVL
jgi:hypothetical protein